MYKFLLLLITGPQTAFVGLARDPITGPLDFRSRRPITEPVATVSIIKTRLFHWNRNSNRTVHVEEYYASLQ